MVVVIGPGWLNASKNGQRRLDDPDDIVRQEILVALERKLLVVPALVDGAALPGPEAMPAALAGLLDRNALELTDLHFDADIQRLEQAIAEHLGRSVEPGDRSCALSRTAGRRMVDRSRGQSRSPGG